MATLRQVIQDEVEMLDMELKELIDTATHDVEAKKKEIATAELKLEHFAAWLEEEVDVAGAAIASFFANVGKK